MAIKLFNKWWKKTIIIGSLLFMFGFAFVFYCKSAVASFSEPYLYDKVKQLPHNKVGLVLGSSKYLANFRINPYFKYRVDAAVKLYRAGKIDYILVSGDNSTKYYNEPEDFQKALMKRGVPKRKIYLDYAGFSTFDSVIRCREIFGQEKFTIISQKFHNERAVYIARKKGMEAIAYNARDLKNKYGKKALAREFPARVKAVLDIYLLGTKPKYLGDKIKIK